MKKFFKFFLVMILLAAIIAAGFNLFMCFIVKDKVKSLDASINDKGYDCIIVLGCGVLGDQPTPLLSDRLDAAIALYKANVAPKILMSGDHGRDGYDEVSVMRQYALDRGIPSEDIFMDHAGFSTYETMYRASEIFDIKKAVVVTQEYHLYRAVYDAMNFGMEVQGAVAEGHDFSVINRGKWQAREVLARTKDVIWCIIKPDPSFLGDKIDISGNGEVTLG